MQFEYLFPICIFESPNMDSILFVCTQRRVLKTMIFILNPNTTSLRF